MIDHRRASKIKPHVNPAPMPRVAVRFDSMPPKRFEPRTLQISNGALGHHIGSSEAKDILLRDLRFIALAVHYLFLCFRRI